VARLAADLTNGIIQQTPSLTAEYFVRVIRLAALVDGPSPSADALQMDVDGQRQDWMLGDGDPARLVVDEVTDAVKEIVGERVVGSFDRDQLWSVRGFVLSHDVVSALSGDEFTPEGLIEAVTAAGYTWTIARVNPSSSV
jgi:hypothetical protein